MSERDDLEKLLQATHERHAQALERELDRRMSRLWRAPERKPIGPLLKPAFALATLALIFLGAWLYDLSQSGGAGPIVLDERYERPQLVLKQPGDPVALTDQLAGREAPPLRLIEPGPKTGIFRVEIYTAVAADQAGNQFLAEKSGRIVKRSFKDGAIQEEVVLEGLDHPNGLAFDRDGSLLVLESGKGRILRVEPVEGEIRAGSPVSVLAEGFGKSVALREDLSERMVREEHLLALELAPGERVRPVYLAVSERGEIFVGEQLDGEAVVYKIGRKSFKWWKFYCLYRC